MSQTITDSLRHLAFIMTPAALGLLVLAPNILSAFFEWGGGKFNTDSTVLCARALMCYAPGLVFFSAAKVLVPAFYAMQDTKTPVRIGLLAVALNLALNITLILILPTYWKHAGLALSTVVCSGANVTALGIILSRRVGGVQWACVFRSAARSLACALIMAAGVWLVARHSIDLARGILPAKAASFGSVLLAVGAGGALYLLLAAVLKSPEIREIVRAIRRK